jgi:cytochrome c peroxidase
MIAVCLAVAVCWAEVTNRDAQPARARAALLRHPIAAAFLNDGTNLCVANQRSGTVSLVDVHRGRLQEELVIGGHPTDLAVLPDGKRVLVVEDKRHELIVLSFDGARLHVQARLEVAPYPASVAVQPDGKRATVASLWSRRVQVIDLTRPTPRVLHTIRLPFAPRNQCVLPHHSQVAVADAFGGRLAVVDAEAGRLVAVHQLNGHNLRGMVLDADGKQLLITHQILDQKVPAMEEKVWRGLLMANVVRALPVMEVRKPRANLEEAGELFRLGGGRGAGDPAGLAIVEGGQIAVALAGIDEVALLRADGQTTRRIAVGRRPTAVTPGPIGQPTVIVNTFDDSLSLLDTRRGLLTGTIALGPQAELTSQDRGERLFFDARLSRDGWFSCHSCHTDGHSNGLLADTLGDNTYGTPKRTLTLRQTALTDPWAWNGEMKYLQDQIEKSLKDTMHAPTVSGDQIHDLLSFLHTLPPPPPLEPVTEDPADRAQVERGRRIFHDRGCARCHIPPLTYSSHGTHDVGFADERGLRKFNPPSLRGVGQGDRFLHDNRAANLEEVFTKFRHKVGSDIAAENLADLLRFLRSL